MFFAESLWSYLDRLSATAIFLYKSDFFSKHAVRVKNNSKISIIINLFIVLMIFAAKVQFFLKIKELHYCNVILHHCKIFAKTLNFRGNVKCK